MSDINIDDLPLYTQLCIMLCRPTTDIWAISKWVMIGNILSSDKLLDVQIKANLAREMRVELKGLEAARARNELIIHPWTGVSKEWDYVLRHMVKTTAGREEAKKVRQELTEKIESLMRNHGAFVSNLVYKIITHMEGAKMAASVRKELMAQMAH